MFEVGIMKKLIIGISVILLALLIILSPFFVISILGNIQNSRIRNEVFTYVLENKNSIELHDMSKSQEFFIQPQAFQLVA